VDPELGGVTTLDVARTSIRSASSAVAVGAGAVWTVYADATLGRLDPASERVETTFAGSRPTAVVVGQTIWV